MDDRQLSQYLRLFHARWLGVARFSRLLALTNTLQTACSASSETLLGAGLAPHQVEQLQRSLAAPNSAAVEQDLAWASTPGQAILCYEDPQYPSLLREIAVAPPLLYVRGEPRVLQQRQLAIVGSRKASSYGLRNAFWMAHDLSTAGLTISSGMARGIDTRAHQAALAARGKTIAVIGTGADVVYPPGNQQLAEEIAANGAIVSEFALGTLPLPANFPRRNRIMSGLSLGVLVVEATPRSGSLITARLALEHNRDVFAVPGPISNAQSTGCHQLIADGARLVQQPADILQELGYMDATAPPRQTPDGVETTNASLPATPSGGVGDTLARLITDQGCELESLMEASGLDYQELLARLLQLEITGSIRCIGGRYFPT